VADHAEARPAGLQRAPGARRGLDFVVVSETDTDAVVGELEPDEQLMDDHEDEQPAGASSDHARHDHAHHDHDHHDHDHDDHDHHDHDHDELSDEEIEAQNERIRQRALAQIRQYPDVALRMKAREVTEFDELLRQLVDQMFRLMTDAQGLGLAATQLGILQRLFVFSPGEDKGVAVIVNPRIVESGSERAVDDEGCLSLPGVHVPVERVTTLTIEGVNASGDAVRFDLEGLPARCVQHELDHLDGVLIIDRTDEQHRKEALGILRPQIVLR
jgi:peptide deformylase